MIKMHINHIIFPCAVWMEMSTQGDQVTVIKEWTSLRASALSLGSARVGCVQLFTHML